MAFLNLPNHVSCRFCIILCNCGFHRKPFCRFIGNSDDAGILPVDSISQGFRDRRCGHGDLVASWDALFHKIAPVYDAELMLLVNDNKAEVVILYRLSKDAVRTNDQGNFAAFDSG